MSNGIVLNHLSLLFDNKVEANKGLLTFFKVLQICKQSGLKFLLIDEDQDKSLMGLKLSQGYFVRDWFNSSKNIPELNEWVRFFKNIETKQPLFDTVDLENLDYAIEVGLKSEPTGVDVLLAAYYFQTFLASFTAQRLWSKPQICVWVHTLSDEIEEKYCKISNLYNEESIEFHRPELVQRRNELISTARNLWEERDNLFPHLKLLSNQIGTALLNWSTHKEIFYKARDSLNVLETFCTKWQAGEYENFKCQYLNDLGLDAEVTGESSSVATNPKLKKHRLFYLDDGRREYFELHIKLPFYYRMHFFADPKRKLIYVAYLGPHLPIS